MTTKMTDTAALAAIGAATSELHLPTVRAEAARLAEIADRRTPHYLAYLADVLAAETRRPRRTPPHPPHPRSPLPPAQTPGRLRPRRRPHRQPGHHRHPWRPAPTSTPASPSCCSATPARARATCSSASAWPPANKAAGSATSPPPNWSTNSPKPPTNAAVPHRRPLRPPRPALPRRTRLRPARHPRRRTAVPDHHRTRGKSLHRHRLQPAVQRMGPSSPTPASSPPSSTGSPSTPTSSRPAPRATGYAPPRPPPEANKPLTRWGQNHAISGAKSLDVARRGARHRADLGVPARVQGRQAGHLDRLAPDAVPLADHEPLA